MLLQIRYKRVGVIENSLQVDTDDTEKDQSHYRISISHLTQVVTLKSVQINIDVLQTL